MTKFTRVTMTEQMFYEAKIHLICNVCVMSNIGSKLPLFVSELSWKKSGNPSLKTSKNTS
jgi:hypothetical protein